MYQVFLHNSPVTFWREGKIENRRVKGSVVLVPIYEDIYIGRVHQKYGYVYI